MPRLQDILFGFLGLALFALMAFNIEVVVLALLGAFACGSIYVFAGMIPSQDKKFWHRLFITVFLSIVMSSLVLILPGTFGAHAVGPGVRKTVVAIAGLLPLAAICLEINSDATRPARHHALPRKPLASMLRKPTASLRKKESRAWQRMLSGRRLDLLDPSPLDIEIDDIAHGLARVARWNGQTEGAYIFSVAQHTLLVDVMARARWPSLDRRARLAVLLHDAPEYVIGDMISPFKAVIGGAYKLVEARLLAAIHLRFGLPAQRSEQIEGMIKTADRGAAFSRRPGLPASASPRRGAFLGRRRYCARDRARLSDAMAGGTLRSDFSSASTALSRELSYRPARGHDDGTILVVRYEGS